MAEGIEVPFFGKLTYYAVSIYVLFILGLLIVCRKRYKSRTQQHRQSATKQKSHREVEEKADEMGLIHGKSKSNQKDDEVVRKRRSKAVDFAKGDDGGSRISTPSGKTANGKLIENDFKEVKESLVFSNAVRSDTKLVNQETLLSEKTINMLSVSKPESIKTFVTSARDDNRNKIAGVINAEVQIPSREQNSTEMGRKRTESCDDKDSLLNAATSDRSKYESVDSEGEIKDVINSKLECGDVEDVKESCSSVSCNYINKEVSDYVCKAIEKNDPLNNFANNSSSSIVNNVLHEIKTSHLKTTEDQVERKEKATMSPKLDEHISDDFCGRDKISKRVKEQIIEYADNLSSEIIYGYYDDDDISAMKPSSINNSNPSTNEKAMEMVSLGFCQAVAIDVCRDAPKTAWDLECVSDKISRSIMVDAVEEYTRLPADQKQKRLVCHRKSNLKVEGQRKKIFCSSENIYHDDTEDIDLQSFSNGIGKGILNNAIKDMKDQYEPDDEINKNINRTQGQKTSGPEIVINNTDLDYMQKVNEEKDGGKTFHTRDDSLSNFDADDEDDSDEDSCYSDESDKETRQPVVLRNKNMLKLKIHSDRPLSGYAEQLMEFLADDDDGLDMFESDEEFDTVLDKLEEKYKDNEGICTKIQKRRRLSESRRKSESSVDTSRGMGKHILSLERLSDEDSRGRLTSTMSESSLLSNTDTDDALRGVFSDDQLVSPGPGKFDLKQTVVVDAGCGILKAGLAGEIAPSQIMPSVIGVPRRFSLDVSKMTRGYYVGEDAIMHAGMLQLDHPIKREVTNWSDVFSLLEYVLEDALQINVRDHPILLTEIGLMPKKHKEKLTEIMFERFGAQAFFLANQGPLSLYSMGLTSGLCLNSGYSTTQAIPVYEGHSLPYCTRQLDIGGQQITNYLGRLLLSERGLAFSSSSEKFLLSDMMERHCYVAEDLKSEEVRLKKHYDDVRKFYELPDGQIIDLDAERFKSAEILYDPEMTGLEQKPLHEMVIDSIAAADQDLKTMLMNNTIVTGGTTLLKGFTKRLESELASLEDHTGHIKLKCANNPVTATWNGASVISSLSTFSQQCITTDQYAEIGSQVVHMKCF